MRIGDWSSDVCSSDLADAVGHQRGTQAARADRRQFLGDDEAVEIVEAGAVPAIFFGITQHEDTGLGRLLMQFARQLALGRSEEHTSELQSLMRISYAVFCLKTKTKTSYINIQNNNETIIELL